MTAPRAIVGLCDGTGRRNWRWSFRSSNVRRMIGYLSPSVATVYVEGPGATGPLPQRIFNRIAALDSRKLARQLVDEIQRLRGAAWMSGAGPPVVHLRGFSRGGGPVQLCAARLLEEVGVQVESMVGFDPVSSLGLPLWVQWLDRRFPQEPPPNVRRWLSILAEHENDIGFTPQVWGQGDPRGLLVTEPGDHAEIGQGSGAFWVWWQWERAHHPGLLNSHAVPPRPLDRHRWPKEFSRQRRKIAKMGLPRAVAVIGLAPTFGRA